MARNKIHLISLGYLWASIALQYRITAFKKHHSTGTACYYWYMMYTAWFYFHSDNQSHTDYDAGGYSPRLLSPGELEPDTIVYEEQDDANRLVFARKNVLKTGEAKVRLFLCSKEMIRSLKVCQCTKYQIY